MLDWRPNGEKELVLARRLSRIVCIGAVLTAACGVDREPRFGAGLDVPYVQTPPGVVTAMLKLAKTGPGDVVVDLGCGDGRIAIAAAKEFGARSIGYDIDPRRIEEARALAHAAGVDRRTRFETRDLFQVRYSKGSVITAFLMPAIMARLRNEFLHGLAPGTRIVSHSFPIPDWQPEAKVEVEGRTIYLFRVPPPTN